MTVTSRSLVIAFGAVVLAFSSATAWSAWRSMGIDRAALSIANRAAPEIEYLAEGRAGIRELQLLANRYARGGPERPSAKQLDAARERFQAQLWAYFALEPDREAASSAELRRSMLTLNQKTWRLLQLIGPDSPVEDDGETAALIGEVEHAADDTARIALEVLEATANRSHDLALHIEAAHHRSLRIAFALDAVSVLLSAAVAWLLYRSLRQQAALAGAHERLLAARAEELEQFAGRVAHDVLGPLTAVMFSISLVRGLTDDPQSTRLLDRGRSSATHVKEIVQALFDFARSGARPDQRSRADVGAAVHGVVEELRTEAELARLELRVAPFAACAVVCAPGILTSMLSNLARNAIKYLGDPPERRVEIRVLPTETRVRVELEDTGPGIPRGLEAEVFKPYVRLPGSTRQGLGLGLAIVKRFAEAHGGSAGVHPAAGRGSVFWFELPAAPGPSPSAIVSSAEPPAAGSPP